MRVQFLLFFLLSMPSFGATPDIACHLPKLYYGCTTSSDWVGHSEQTEILVRCQDGCGGYWWPKLTIGIEKSGKKIKPLNSGSTEIMDAKTNITSPESKSDPDLIARYQELERCNNSNFSETAKLLSDLEKIFEQLPNYNEVIELREKIRNAPKSVMFQRPNDYENTHLVAMRAYNFVADRYPVKKEIAFLETAGKQLLEFKDVKSKLTDESGEVKTGADIFKPVGNCLQNGTKNVWMWIKHDDKETSPVNVKPWATSTDLEKIARQLQKVYTEQQKILVPDEITRSFSEKVWDLYKNQLEQASPEVKELICRPPEPTEQIHLKTTRKKNEAAVGKTESSGGTPSITGETNDRIGDYSFTGSIRLSSKSGVGAEFSSVVIEGPENILSLSEGVWKYLKLRPKLTDISEITKSNEPYCYFSNDHEDPVPFFFKSPGRSDLRLIYVKCLKTGPQLEVR